ncbi:hypothetical protein VTK26DRAFT_5783 [Humicola hyalothermophila]
MVIFKRHKEVNKEDEAGTARPVDTPSANTKPSAPVADDNEPKVATSILNDDDERFLERLVSNSDDDDDDDDDDDEGPPPPLPPRPRTPNLTWDSDSDSFRNLRREGAPPGETSTATKAKKPSRLSRLFHRKPPSTSTTTLSVPSGPVPPREAEREWADLNHVLSRLDLNLPPAEPTSSVDPSDPSTTTTTTKSNSPSKTKRLALTASSEVQSLLRQFLLVLKDIMRGAPHAVDDLVALLDGRNGALRRGFDRLPSSLQKLVTQLPKKLTASFGPEVLAAAAAEREAKGGGGLGRLLLPGSVGELVMTPAIIKAMLKAIVNALKVRWPAFAGTSMLWSTAVFLLLFVLWYFHKRGREEREKQEAAEAERKGVEGENENESSAVVVVQPPTESPQRE